MSVDEQQDPGVSGAAVLEQGGSSLPGTLRRTVVEGGGWKSGSHDHECRDQKNERVTTLRCTSCLVVVTTVSPM